MGERFWSPTKIEGWRTWAVRPDGWLCGPITSYKWQPGVNEADHVQFPVHPLLNAFSPIAPPGDLWCGPNCAAGFNCHMTEEAAKVDASDMFIWGRILLSGLVREYESGYRGQYAEIVGPLRTPSAFIAWRRQLAIPVDLSAVEKRYGIPVEIVEPDPKPKWSFLLNRWGGW